MSQLFVDDVVSKEGTQSVGFSKGISVSVASTFSGDVSIAGTLTYEDVTNIDVTGIITAKGGVQLGAAGIGGTIRANWDTTLVGVVTATKISVNENSAFNDADEYLLVKNSDAACNVSIVGSPSNHSTLNMGDTGDFNVQKIKSDHTNNSLQFFTNDGERVRIASDGNVGIGTTFAELKLHIQDGKLASAPTPNSNCDVVIEGASNTGIQFLSATQTQLRFGDADSNAAGSIIYNHSADNFRLNYSNSGYLSLNDGGGETFRFTPNNEIGIAGANYGTSGQVLTSGGSGSAVSWEDAGGGGWEVVSTISLPDDYGSSSISFTGFTTAYTQYQIAYVQIANTADAGKDYYIKFYVDGEGSVWSSSVDYRYSGYKQTFEAAGSGFAGNSSTAWRVFNEGGVPMVSGNLYIPMRPDVGNTLMSYDLPWAYGTLFGGNQISREQCRMNDTATNRGRYISGVQLSTSDGTNLRSGRATLLRQKYS